MQSLYQRLRSPSFDAIAASAVAFATGGIVYQAYDEGHFPLTRQIHGRDCSLLPPRLTLSKLQCRTLETNGYLVIDDFMSAKEVANAAQAAKDVEARRPLSMASIKNKFTGIRADRVCFFAPDYVGATEAAASEEGPHLTDAAIHDVRKLLRGLAQSIAESDFRGFDHGARNAFLTTATSSTAGNNEAEKRDRYLAQRTWMGVPETIQLASYEGLDKSNENNEPQSNYNAAHRDGGRSDWWNTGLLGHLRSTYLRRRYITGIVYLNEATDGPWLSERDGGQLRLYVGADGDDWTGDTCDGTRVVDISPHGGRLVLLSSEHILHAVMPCFRDRIACSIWFTLNS